MQASLKIENIANENKHFSDNKFIKKCIVNLIEEIIPE